jgi:hypothetical protein
MSREIPMDRALTDEDRSYLRQRGAYGSALEARLDQQFPPDPDSLAEFDAAERKANGHGLTPDDQTALTDEVARLRAQVAELTAAKATVDYSGWKKADLEAEVDRVNAEDPNAGLAKGTVAEMSAALTAYFAG